MKNNNQKYIAKAALFIPYALCAEKSEEDIKPLIFDTGDYMSNFPEINMMTKCSYLETKNGSIAKFTDHVEFLDRWQFLDDLRQKKVKFLVIPNYPEFEDDDHDFAENIKTSLKPESTFLMQRNTITLIPKFRRIINSSLILTSDMSSTVSVL